MAVLTPGATTPGVFLGGRGWRRWVVLLATVLLVTVNVPAWAQDTAADETPAATGGAPAAAPADFATLVDSLVDAGYADKDHIAGEIVESGNPRARIVLQALLDGKLYADGNKQVYIVGDAPDDASELPVSDAVSGDAHAPVAADQLDRIGTNNGLRKGLKGLIAQLKLNDPDAGVRQRAVKEMLRDLDESTIAALRARRAHEDNARVLAKIDVGLALGDLESSDVATQLSAANSLYGELDDDVYNRLKPLADAGDGDPRVRAAASKAVKHIEFWREIYDGLQTLFFGLSLGSVLVLSAIGLAITFGVMGVINMAHGELMMLGAYTAYVMQLLMPNHLALSLLLSIPAAFVVSGLMGVAIERGVVRFLYGRPLETLLATFGLSLVLQQLVRSIFSPLNRSVATPEFMSGVWQLNDLFALTWNRLYIVVFALIVFAVLQLVLKRTSLGLKVRAVSMNRAMARAMGVRSQWVDAATFGLGSGIAGIAGVALSQLTNVGPNLGQSYIIDSFMVVVFGGVGNLWGTLISGMSLGVASKLLEPWAGAVMAKIFVLVFLILFIQRRPRGLFPQKGRAAEG
ncbi:urea ABC transporter permease subunit UrtB [Solimonas terrae]|uniref:urea ABC transporter permease subunit UrtB n=1 Tax=Solimonas terrae TaxID=1396819 RepID=UPI00344F189A